MLRRHRIFLLGLLIAIALTPAAAFGTIGFQNVSTIAGLANEYYDTSTEHSLGLLWIDYDNDEWPDLFAVNGSQLPVHLYHNNRDGTFARVDSLIPPLAMVEKSGSFYSDYDNDGDKDIFIYTDQDTFEIKGPGNPPDGPVDILLKNKWVENGNKALVGQALFVDVAAAAGVEGRIVPPLGTLPARRGKTAGWFDYDRDGWTDLFVGQTQLNHGGSIANRALLFRNLGNGTFQDVTDAAGLYPGNDTTLYRCALGFAGAHLDNDLWPDMYIVNFTGNQDFYHNDLLYKNNGNGTFTNTTGLSPGLGDDSEAGMGIDLADIELDGDWDIYQSDLYFTDQDSLPLGNPLYLGNGDGTFTDNVAVAAGVEGFSSWGVCFFDVDRDGWEDLYVATADILYRNNRDGTFTEVVSAGGLVGISARGAIPADYDRDGDLDVALVNEDGPIELFKNISTNMGNWVQFRLRGVQSNKLGIGAVIKVVAGSKNMMRQVKGGNSAHSQDSGVQHFGLGTTPLLTSVQVLWPSGVVDVLSNITVNRFITIVEGSTGTSIAFEPPPAAFDLAQNSPNPFGPRTRIRFSLARDASIKVAVYDAAGARVATLASGSQGAGQHSLEWDGTDERGRHVAPGVYFCELSAPGAHLSKKMLLVH